MSAQAPLRASTMKAVVYHRYGSPDVLRLEDVAMPIVGDDDVLVRVHAVSLNPVDWHMLRGLPYLIRLEAGLRRPKRTIPGVDVAGRVEAVGSNVTRFQPGDEVFGHRGRACAEYLRASEQDLVPKPPNVSFEQAAASPVAGLTALQALRDKGRIQPGQSVLIDGASGGVGTFAVQIAAAFGGDVTGVCSTRNVELVRSIGAHHVIDHTREDVTRSGQRFDLIVDAVGDHSLSSFRRILRPHGILVLVGAPQGDLIAPLARMVLAGALSRLGSQRFLSHLTTATNEDLMTLRDMLETGKVSPVIDRCCPLREVPDALRYLETRRARGKVVITV